MLQLESPACRTATGTNRGRFLTDAALSSKAAGRERELCVARWAPSLWTAYKSIDSASRGASHVDHAPVRIHDALVHHLGQGRVREYRLDQFLFGGLEVHRDHVALDEFRHLRANHVRPEKLT